MKNLFLLLSIACASGILTSCSRNAEVREDITASTLSVQKAGLNNLAVTSFGTKDERPLLSCNTYTAADKIKLAKEFNDSLAKYSTFRGKSVAAAIFLAKLQYCVPYAYEWKTVTPGYALVARYTRKGLFLNNVTESENGVTVTYPAWGCLVKTPANYPRHTVEGLGDYYENGFHCSSFVGWCLYNSNTITNVTRLDTTYANNYHVFPQTRAVQMAYAAYWNLIMPGDLIWFEGHVAMVVKIENGNMIYVSAEGGTKHDNKRGVRWLSHSLADIAAGNFHYTTLIQMKTVYGEGPLDRLPN